jgi:hypothetical protein
MDNPLSIEGQSAVHAKPDSVPRVRWLNRTVLGIGLASLFSDWSHEMATAVMPAFLAAMGVGAVWLRWQRHHFRGAMRRGNAPAIVNVLYTGIRCACDVAPPVN